MELRSTDSRIYNLDFLDISTIARRTLFNEMVVCLIKDAIEDYFNYAIESGILLSTNQEELQYFINGELVTFLPSIGDMEHFQYLALDDEVVGYIVSQDEMMQVFVKGFYEHLKAILDERVYKHFRGERAGNVLPSLMFTYMSPFVMLYELELNKDTIEETIFSDMFKNTVMFNSDISEWNVLKSVFIKDIITG